MLILTKNKTDRIIAYIFEHPETKIKVTEVAKILNVNKGSVSLTVKNLENEKLVKNKIVNISNPLTRALKIAFNVAMLSDSKTLNLMKDYALASGLYGSAAKGTNTADSDIDIWIRPKPGVGQIKVTELSRKLSNMLNKRVQIISITEERVRTIKKESINFYYTLIFGSIILFGEEFE